VEALGGRSYFTSFPRRTQFELQADNQLPPRTKNLCFWDANYVSSIRWDKLDRVWDFMGIIGVQQSLCPPPHDVRHSRLVDGNAIVFSLLHMHNFQIRGEAVCGAVELFEG